jgi:hypothetical protein
MPMQILHLIRDMIWTLPSCVRLVVTVPPASSHPDLRNALAALPHEILTPADLLKANDIQVGALIVTLAKQRLATVLAYVSMYDCCNEWIGPSAVP